MNSSSSGETEARPAATGDSGASPRTPSMPGRASDPAALVVSGTDKLPTYTGILSHLLWRSNRLFVGNKALFCLIKSLFWRTAGKASFRCRKVAENLPLLVFRRCSLLLQTLFSGAK